MHQGQRTELTPPRERPCIDQTHLSSARDWTMRSMAVLTKFHDRQQEKETRWRIKNDARRQRLAERHGPWIVRCVVPTTHSQRHASEQPIKKQHARSVDSRATQTRPTRGGKDGTGSPEQGSSSPCRQAVAMNSGQQRKTCETPSETDAARGMTSHLTAGAMGTDHRTTRTRHRRRAQQQRKSRHDTNRHGHTHTHTHKYESQI